MVGLFYSSFEAFFFNEYENVHGLTGSSSSYGESSEEKARLFKVPVFVLWGNLYLTFLGEPIGSLEA